jgi:hypothetical protein
MRKILAGGWHMRKYKVGDIVEIQKKLILETTFKSMRYVFVSCDPKTVTKDERREMCKYRLVIECEPSKYGVRRWLVVAKPEYAPYLREDQKIYICEEDYFDLNIIEVMTNNYDVGGWRYR